MAGGGRGRARFVGIAVLYVGALSLVWALAGPGTETASAGGTSCAQRVLRDWTDNGRVDGLYPSKCYMDAIASLPEDVRTYSSAVDDISRAMQSSQQAESTKADAQTGPTVGQTAEARRISTEEARQIAAQSPSAVRGLPPALLAVIVIAGAMAVSGVVAYFLRRSRDAP
jgi:hypothetical protein